MYANNAIDRLTNKMPWHGMLKCNQFTSLNFWRVWKYIYSTFRLSVVSACSLTASSYFPISRNYSFETGRPLPIRPTCKSGFPNKMKKRIWKCRRRVAILAWKLSFVHLIKSSIKAEQMPGSASSLIRSTWNAVNPSVNHINQFRCALRRVK